MVVVIERAASEKMISCKVRKPEKLESQGDGRAGVLCTSQLLPTHVLLSAHEVDQNRSLPSSVILSGVHILSLCS